MLINVDDILLVSKDKGKVQELKRQLIFDFEMKDIGQPKKFLGISIAKERDKGILKIHQKGYLGS